MHHFSDRPLGADLDPTSTMSEKETDSCRTVVHRTSDGEVGEFGSGDGIAANCLWRSSLAATKKGSSWPASARKNSTPPPKKFRLSRKIPLDEPLWRTFLLLPMNHKPFLPTIHSPADVKALEEKDLPLLAEEVRAELIRVLSQTGGHLGPNLGVVELTIALHRVFNTPKDKFVFDVSHQGYVHKLFTGRRERFSSIRQYQGLNGFLLHRERARLLWRGPRWHRAVGGAGNGGGARYA